MFAQFKKHLREFEESEPGHRFQDRYWRRKKESKRHVSIGKMLNIVGGIVITLLGVFFMAAPGPGTIVAVVGLAMLGSEFLALARLLDWAEPKVRALVEWGLRIWHNFSPAVKVLALVLMAAMGVLAAYVAWRLFR